MDVDFWPSRVLPAKHLSAVQAAKYTTDHHLLIDDSDGDDDARAYFPCPFCYVDIEIHVLCSHLQNEHCFDLKNAVCPLCAANLGKDVIGHFIVHHASSLKRRRKSLKSGPWIGSSAMINKDLGSFLGSSANGRANINEAAPDPLLSPFLGGVSHSHPKGSEQDESCKMSAHSASFEISWHGGGDKLDSEERRQRAAFVQQLIASTII
ncbi:protein DEHYDRATION-INDUCED 19 homolog 5 [Ricinus communis]|uniref:protein DEHYDRATION-INDUCED 19 homolog 5 n=1 Tax=Ricinus communis TaxID=3988 RepID=UPI000772A261|nr:protein DEHYDRATION-INDUCED 19 homolog 5 [Ricinus communis]|eukprot:XP_015579826.1 protein DEHYDRATION-INDUCED 19 homolog 5 [Ricinus communis]